MTIIVAGFIVIIVFRFFPVVSLRARAGREDIEFGKEVQLYLS
jgi:hypothetical protein